MCLHVLQHQIIHSPITRQEYVWVFAQLTLLEVQLIFIVLLIVGGLIFRIGRLIFVLKCVPKDISDKILLLTARNAVIQELMPILPPECVSSIAL